MTTRIYLMGQRKNGWWYDLSSRWKEVAFERFDYVECAIYEIDKREMTDEDKEWYRTYKNRPEGWIEPHKNMHKLYDSGYILIVSSWENDLDNRSTTTAYFDNVKQALYAKEAAELCAEGQQLCNLYSSSEIDPGQFETIAKTLYYKYFTDDFEHAESVLLDCLYDIGLGNTEFFTRYSESIKLLYADSAIYLEQIT